MTAAMHRLGGLCAHHAAVVLVAWVVVAAGLGLAIQVFGAQTDNDLSLPGTDSQRATDVLAARFAPQQNGTSPIVFYAADGTLTDEAHKDAVKDAIHQLRQAPHVYSALSPVGSKGQSAGLLSEDKATAYAPVLLDIDSGSIDEELAQQILDSAREPAEQAGIQVEAGGAIGSRLSEPATESSEVVGLTAAMVILTIVLGSLVAMGLPILTAVFALSAALSLIGLLGHVFGIPSIAPTVATMIGLGVGIDYALFLVTRHKDQLAQGVAMRDSIAQAVATSGSAIVFAGTTVIIALVCLVVADIPLVTAMGFSAAIAVLAAVLGAVTLLPALLSLAGDRIHLLALPSFLQRREARGGRSFWGRWAAVVTRHPWWAVVGSLAALVPLIIPVFSLELGQEDIAVAPTSTTERRAYDLVTNGLGVGYNGPLLVAVVLEPVAAPSASYEKKYNRAIALKKELKQEQKSLTAQQQELEQQQAALEAQQSDLQAQSADLQAQQATLLSQEASLRAQQQQLQDQQSVLEQRKAILGSESRALRADTKQLAVAAERTAAALVAVRAREALLQERIDSTTNPNKLARLQARLDRVLAREDLLVERAATLRREGERLLDRARALESQAKALQAEAAALTVQGDQLQQEAAGLTAQGEALQRQADALQAEADTLQQQASELQRQANRLKSQKKQAEQQQKEAEKLQRQLTRELTQAGGDDRATDDRVVDLQNTLLATPGIVALTPPQLSDKGDALVLNAVPDTAPASDQTAALVTDLRDAVIPEATSEGGVTAYIGGYTASYVDLASKIADRLPLVVATVLGLSFLLLLLAFRSLLVPLQAALMNLLSVAASFGVLTAVFQWGWGLSLVGLDAPDGTVPIASYVPLMMFAILFGLSMDYEVFLVSHVVAYHESGQSPARAVASGLAASARVISAAALIMICVFGSFILNGDPTVKQFGVGLSVAVFLAAALVLVLAPALLTLFGRATWRLPTWLDRVVPDIGLDEGPMPDTAPERVTTR
jgi:uncharacterized membrane protein YdfJ with MMPL/SSD domain